MAIACPMPELPPVTMAVLPCSPFMTRPSRHCVRADRHRQGGNRYTDGGDAVGELADTDPMRVQEDDGEEVRVAGGDQAGPLRPDGQGGEGEQRDGVPGLDGRGG